MSRRGRRFAVFLLVVSAIFLIGWPGGATLPIPLSENGVPTLAPLLARVTPGVVNIAVKGRIKVQQNPLFRDPFFRRFFELPEQPAVREFQSVGSGVIVDAAEGHLLTNHHVIAEADEITVTLKDGRRLAAKLVGSDPATDIALLSLPAGGLTALEFGDSERLAVGDFVVAIGNPFGLGQTVTSGIVSALGRGGINAEGYEDFIQTDAPINPGNSGGALVDLKGRLVGINSAIIAPGGGNVGIGFAVPANMARAVMVQLLAYGEVRRGRLGVTAQTVTPDMAEGLGLAEARGAVVTAVEPGSSAAAAGLAVGDVIVAVDGRAVAGAADLRNIIGLTPVGKEVTLTLFRKGEKRTVSARIARSS